MNKNPLLPESSLYQAAPVAYEGFASRHPKDEMSFGDVSRILQRQRKLILASSLAGITLALIASLLMTPKYRSEARVELKPTEGNKLGLSDFTPDAGASGDDLGTNLSTVVQMFHSNSLAMEAIQGPLAKDPSYNGVSEQKPGQPARSLADDPERRTKAIKRFEHNLDVSPVPGTRLLQISFKDPDSDRASQVVNSLIENYNADYIRRYYLGSVQASEWLQKQISDLRRQVTNSEDKLTAYGRQNGFFGFIGTGTDSNDSPILQKLVALNQSVVQAQAERIQREATAKLLATRDPEVIVGLGSGAQGGVSQADLTLLQSLRLRKAEVSSQYAQMETRYGAKYPGLVETKSQLDALQNSISQVIENLRLRAVNDYAVAKENEQMLQHSFDQQAAEANQLNDKATQYKLLAKEAEGNRALYENLVTKLREAQVAASVRGSNVVLLDPAMPMPHPSSPNYPLNLAIGLGAGLLVGLGSSFYRARGDQAIESLSAFEAISPFPVLGSVPRLQPVARHRLATVFVRRLAKSTGKTQRRSRRHQVTIAAEAYNQIRTSLLLRAKEHVPRTILVTSPLSRDGKSTTVAGLGMTFATSGSKVLVLGADLRNGRAHEEDASAPTKGLWDLLTEKGDPQKFVESHGSVKDLFFLPAGDVTKHPLTMLESPRFREILEELKSSYDFVIIDSPPTAFFADVSVMTPHVDAIVLVVRAGVTSQQAFERSCNTLLHAQGTVLGVIVNDLPPNSESFYGYYGYRGKDFDRSYANA